MQQPLSYIEQAIYSKKKLLTFNANDTGHIIPNEKTQTLKLQEFVDIISIDLGIKTLSHAEKGKLWFYEISEEFGHRNNGTGNIKYGAGVTLICF